GRRARRSSVEGHRRELLRRDRLEVRPAPAGQCDGQLHEGRPARAGPHQDRRLAGPELAPPRSQRRAHGRYEVRIRHSPFVGARISMNKKWLIAISVALGALLEIIDTSIVNVALSDMQASLGATVNQISWVVSSYAIANVIILPLSAWLG